jgi:NADH-quinone oxidoreductase subunit N
LQGFGSWSADWVPLVAGLSLVTILVGNLLALSQTNVKRLLAYSGVSQVGYMLMAFACANSEGLGMLLFYGVGYTVTNMGAFLIVQALAAAGGDDSLESFDGLSRRSPGLALSMLLFLLSLAGIPFVVGFWGKLYVFLAAWHAGLGWLVVVGAVFAVVALFYYLQIARAMYINPAHDPKPIPLPHGLRLAIALCLVFVVGIGAWPNPVVVATSAAARQLFSIIEASAVALH